MLEKDTIHIGTVIRHTILDEYWTITDVYFNLHTNTAEFMAKSDYSERGALYITQEIMLNNIEYGIFIPYEEEE